MSHLVDTHRHRQDDDVVLARFNLHAIGITDPEPLLRYLGHLIAPLANGVLVVEDVAGISVSYKKSE